jgi:hypothetical protein
MPACCSWCSEWFRRWVSLVFGNGMAISVRGILAWKHNIDYHDMCACGYDNIKADKSWSLVVVACLEFRAFVSGVCSSSHQMFHPPATLEAPLLLCDAGAIGLSELPAPRGTCRRPAVGVAKLYLWRGTSKRTISAVLRAISGS